jgi:hypothetical protein
MKRSQENIDIIYVIEFLQWKILKPSNMLREDLQRRIIVVESVWSLFSFLYRILSFHIPQYVAQMLFRFIPCVARNISRDESSSTFSSRFLTIYPSYSDKFSSQQNGMKTGTNTHLVYAEGVHLRIRTGEDLMDGRAADMANVLTARRTKGRRFTLHHMR